LSNLLQQHPASVPLRNPARVLHQELRMMTMMLHQAHILTNLQQLQRKEKREIQRWALHPRRRSLRLLLSVPPLHLISKLHLCNLNQDHLGRFESVRCSSDQEMSMVNHITQ